MHTEQDAYTPLAIITLKSRPNRYIMPKESTLQEMTETYSNSQRHLIVSFHDLHPGSMADCTRFLRKIEPLGVTAANLLTVPDWHGQTPISNHPDFCHWLRQQQHQHDITLHGLQHRATQETHGTMAQLIAHRYTAGEGEFFRLPAHLAEPLIRKGLDDFLRIGIHPHGFIAPAWLFEPDQLPIIKKLGFTYTVSFRQILNLAADRYIPAPVLVCSTRSLLRRQITRQVVASLARYYESAPILRIAVHPIDFHYPEIEAFNYRMIAQAMEDRTCVTYRDLCRPHPTLETPRHLVKAR